MDDVEFSLQSHSSGIIRPLPPLLPPSGGIPIRTHTYQVIKMSFKTASRGIQVLSPDDIAAKFKGKSPYQATCFYNKCMTNVNTPDENIALFRQFRAANPQLFMPDDQVARIRASKGTPNGRSGFFGRSKDRVYSDGYSYDNRGNAYDPYGNPVGGWQDGGRDREYGTAYMDTYAKGSGFFRRKQKPISEPRSIEELGETLKRFNNPIRGRLYIDGIIKNSQSNPQTVENAKHFLAVNSSFVANDEQLAAYRASHPNQGFRQSGGQRRGFFSFARKPIDQPRTDAEIQNTLIHLKGNVERTRYHDKVLANKNSNPETVQRLIAFRQANPQLFASPEEVAAAPHRNTMASRFWMPKEEFDTMSPRKKMFFVGAVKRNNRQKNSSYYLRGLTNPETTTEDRIAMVQIVREFPGLFFSKASPSRRQNQE